MRPERRVATMQGDNAEEFLQREERDFEILSFPTFTDALTALSAGDCDAVVMQRLVALRLVVANGLMNLRVVDKPIMEFAQDFSFAVQEGDRDTLALLNEGLNMVEQNGQYREIYDKWMGAYVGRLFGIRVFLHYLALIVVPLILVLVLVCCGRGHFVGTFYREWRRNRGLHLSD